MNKEAEVDFFFVAVFGKSKCDWPKRCSHFENYFLPQTKNWHNRTTVLYNKYVCNTKNYFPPEQKTNTMPQLYCVCNTKTYFPPEAKKLTQQHNWKKVPPAHTQRVYSSLCPSFHLSVRAKRGIWSKRVLMRKIGNFSFGMHWRNTMIIH